MGASGEASTTFDIPFLGLLRFQARVAKKLEGSEKKKDKP